MQSLLDRVAAGDRQAFEDLYACTVRRLFGLAVKVVRSRELAEEIVQEVYLQVWLTAGAFDPSRGSTSTLAWLFTLTHRRSIDAVRREQSSLERDSRHYRETVVLGQGSAEELILLRLENEKVLASLSMISPSQSTAIALVYFGGLTCPEVAVTLNLSVSAVKSRIRDGLGNLRKILGPPLSTETG